MAQEIDFQEMLSGGHPNSLGRTVEVVDIVLANQAQLPQLFDCYFCDNELVRLRVSNAMKRICREQPTWIVPYLDRLIEEVSQIDQASAQWTLAQLLLALQAHLSPSQKTRAVVVLQRNLETSQDWIVQNTTMETLAAWAKRDADLRQWVLPRLRAFTGSSRKSVAGRAQKMLNMLDAVEK